MTRAIAIALLLSCAAGCTTVRQNMATDFEPPSGNYAIIVVRPDVSVGVLTAGGMVEQRADWTEQATTNLIAAIEAHQTPRDGHITIARTLADANADPALVADLSRLHRIVGTAIRLHKYTGTAALPTKKNTFDWTLGEKAVEYGTASQNDYALFIHVEDSFSSGGRVALQAMGFLSCAFGICIIPPGGQQVAFASLVDLHTGNIPWFNVLVSDLGDVREREGADKLITRLLGGLKDAADKGRP